MHGGGIYVEAVLDLFILREGLTAAHTLFLDATTDNPKTKEQSLNLRGAAATTSRPPPGDR